jgi:hypothetical protein
VTLHAFWADPRYRADDHREAVRFLQEHWRPGDVVLVNAGYTYTALLTYWDGPIATRGRLTGELPTPRADAALVLLTTGHVDAAPNLGWADPRSDFFAMPATVAGRQLADLFKKFPRVWHYRIYDTVNDPQGRIRAWLEENGQRFEDRVFAGEANMRVQGFVPRKAATPDLAWPAALFGAGLTVRAEPLPAQIAAGETLYPVVTWEVTAPTADFATSVRLVGPEGAVWAQPPDEQPLGPLFPADRWPPGQPAPTASPGTQRQPLALPVPVGTPPGDYTIELVVYDPATGRPWIVRAEKGGLAITANGVNLGQINVVRATTESRASGEVATAKRVLARFGPLALVEATSPATIVAPGGQVPVELLWQAGQGTLTEPLVVVLQLLDDQGRVAAGLEAQPLDGRYPTQQWVAGELVRDRHTMTLPADLPPGGYRLIVGLYRAADRARFTTQVGLFGTSDHVAIKTLTVR